MMLNIKRVWPLFILLLFANQANALTISGTCKQADKITDCTDTGTIRAAHHGSGGTLFTQTQNIVAGTWTISGLPALVPGLIITVFIEGAPDHQEAVAVFNYGSTVGDVTGVELIETHLSLGADTTAGLSNNDLSTYDNSVSGSEDIFHDVDNTVSRNLTVDITGAIPSPTLYIKNNHSFSPGGNLNAHHVEINGTLGLGSNTMNVSGDWEVTGTFYRDTSTVNFNGSSNQTLSAGGDYFYNVTINNTGVLNNNTVSIDSNTNFYNDLVINNGTLNTTATNYNLTVLGNFDQSSSTGELKANASTITVTGNFSADGGGTGSIKRFNYNNATIELIGSGTLRYANLYQTWANGFNNLTVGQPGHITTLISTNFAANNVLTVGSGVFTGTGSSIFLRGSNPLNVDLNATIRLYALRFFNNGSIQNIPPLNNGYDTHIILANYNSRVTQTGHITLNTSKNLFLTGDNFQDRSVTYNTGGFDLNVGGGIFIGASGGNDTATKTLDINGSTVTVENNFEIRTGTNSLLSDNSTVIFNGNNNQNISANGNPFYNVTIDNTGALNSNTVSIDSNITLNNDLVINNGVFNTTTNHYNLTMLGNLDQSSPNGELRANASIITVTGDFSADGGASFSKSQNYNNATVELIGSGTLTYANMKEWWANGFKNLSVGQSGKTTTMPSLFAVRDVLTVGSGTFTGSGSLYLRGANPLSLDLNATINLSTLRFFGGNQTIPPLNNGYDTHIILANYNSNVTQTGSITLNAEKNLDISGDEFPDRAVTYNTNGFSLNVGGGISIGRSGGNDTGLKTLDISNSTVTVGRNFEIRTGTNDLISTNSTITLNGTAAQAVIMNSKAMDALTVNNASSAGVTFNDAFTANTVTNTTPNSTITFAAGQDFTVNNAINIQGASGQLINLVSSSPGSNWNLILNAGVTKNINHVNVSWSDASGSHSTQKGINPSNSLDGGNTIDWFTATFITIEKEATLISDPINGSGANKNHIPGAIIEYNITTNNTGTASPDANTVMIIDNLDANVEYDVATGVSFVDGTTSSGLTLGTVSFSHSNTPTDYTYTPTGSFDPNVASIKVETSGTFAFGGSPAPEFTLSYRVRLK